MLLRAGQSFQTKNGLLYCIADCRELFAPKCNRCCKAPPEGEGLFQLKASTGGTGSKESSSSAICQACFSCAHCGKALGSGEPYQIKDGLYYCTNDFTQLFAPKCGDCNEPITGKFLDVLGSKRHLNCFKCGACGIVLANGKHFVDEIDGKKTPLCEKDYLERNSPKCEHCHISMQKWLIVQGHQLCRRCHTDIVPCFSCHTLTMKGSKATTSMKATTAPTTGGKSSTTATSTSSSDREVVSDFPLAMDLRDDRHVCPTCHASAIVLDNDAALLLAEVKEVLLELGLEQFRSGGAMDHLVVSLVSRADLKKQVHCRAAVPLGVTLSQTESKWNKCTETATTRVPAPESPALPPPSSKGQGLAAAAPSPRQSKSSSPRSSRAAASAKVAPSTPRGRSPRPAPKAHTHSPNVLKQRPPSPRPARPRTSSQVTRATAAADNRSAVTVTVTEVQVASAVKKEPLKPGYLPSALETTITTTTTTATTYAVSSVSTFILLGNTEIFVLHWNAPQPILPTFFISLLPYSNLASTSILKPLFFFINSPYMRLKNLCQSCASLGFGFVHAETGGGAAVLAASPVRRCDGPRARPQLADARALRPNENQTRGTCHSGWKGILMLPCVLMSYTYRRSSCFISPCTHTSGGGRALRALFALVLEKDSWRCCL